MDQTPSPRRRIDRQGIADLAQVTPAAVTNWIRRHPEDFPKSLDGEFFDAAEVQSWLERTGRGRKVTITAEQQAQQLRSLLLEDLPREVVEVYAVTLVTIAAATQDKPWQFPTDAAEELEANGTFPGGSLSGPLISTSVAKPTADAALKAAYEAIRRGHEAQIDPADIVDALLGGRGGSRLSNRRNSSAEIADFMAALLPSTCRTIYDPACGLGANLLAARSHLGPEAQLSGSEVDSTTWALCVQRMYLAAASAEIRREDAAEVLEQFPLLRVDAIVTSPRFDPKSDPDGPMSRLAARHRLPSRSDLVWALTSLENLKPDGTVVLNSGPGALHRGGSERKARLELVRSGALRAVFLLPPTARRDAGFRSAVLVLGHRTAEPGPVLMVDLDSDDLTNPEQVLDQYRQWLAAPEFFQGVESKSTAVPVLDLMAGDVNLTPTFWLQVERDPEQARVTALHRWTQLGTSHANMPGPLTPLNLDDITPTAQEITLGQLAEAGQIEILRDIRRAGVESPTVAGPLVRGVGADGDLTLVEDSDSHASTVESQAGDVILSPMGNISAGVDTTGGHRISGQLWIIRPLVEAPNLDPELLAHLLRSPRIKAIAASQSSSLVRLRHPKEVAIPLFSSEQAELLLGKLREAQALRHAASKVARDAADAIDALIEAVETGNVVRGVEQ